MPNKTEFSYSEAFSRNIGWLLKDEQTLLQTKKVAIAGLGGVGGSHLLTLTRLGLGHFHIADFDHFELANFNRQAGAIISNLGKPKIDALASMAKDINPELDITLFPEGISHDNLDHFLEGVDIYVDGLDFFVLDIRRAIFRRCAELGIPAVTVAPLGMGAALLNFLPEKMTFEQYFQLDGHTQEEQYLRFLLGLAPAMLQNGYLVAPEAVDLASKKGPSTPMACEMCAGLAGTQVLKILLGRGKIYSAPTGLQFDAYKNKMKKTWRPGGNQNPLQQIGLMIGRRVFRKKYNEVTAKDNNPTVEMSAVEKIIDTAKWAPSGDNTQPWRFEIKSDEYFVVHAYDTREHCVYDLEGHGSQLAIGALLETITIAANHFGFKATISQRENLPETSPTFDVNLSLDSNLKPDPLYTYIPIRSVQRRAMKTRHLTDREKMELENTVAPEFKVKWLEGFSNRFKTASLMYKNAGVRLTMPEAYEVHKNIIEWRTKFSYDRIPEKALGIDPLLTRSMEWALKSWKRVAFMNRYMAGTVMPRIEMDLLPGIACGAHFALVCNKPPDNMRDYLLAGRKIQRFWLTATKLGLQLQPETTPLIFASYLKNNITFTSINKIEARSKNITEELKHLLQEQEITKVMFMGRIGAGELPISRSLRLSLNTLIQSK
ncbi:MAG: ThiF family adenylyltransferase [Gammaproteobacteria bacterium]|nr:ThiF family adenylyltransferase [Gammaproteobacteria bacterium]MDH5593056.1 ThiF family adenylyltransferase [Gammaproteobacteria bacterium]MDH5613546.1 ThiF family adenylyltransferase [Gammaproteobacteria bacterium]